MIIHTSSSTASWWTFPNTKGQFMKQEQSTLIVKFPQTIKPDKKRNSDLLNFIDFAPTVISIAGSLNAKFIRKAFRNKKTENKRTFLFTASDRFDEHSDRIRAVEILDINTLKITM